MVSCIISSFKIKSSTTGMGVTENYIPLVFHLQFYNQHLWGHFICMKMTSNVLTVTSRSNSLEQGYSMQMDIKDELSRNF
jgi:hypothetical protein